MFVNLQLSHVAQVELVHSFDLRLTVEDVEIFLAIQVVQMLLQVLNQKVKTHAFVSLVNFLLKVEAFHILFTTKVHNRFRSEKPKSQLLH